MTDDEYIDQYQSPIGTITMGANNGGLTFVSFHQQLAIKSMGTNEHTRQFKFELDIYFAKGKVAFRTPVVLEGSTFSKQVYEYLMANVPSGHTIDYGRLAEQTHTIMHTRAVAKVNAENKHALIIPCHRVIGKNGRLTGYAWGLEKKQWLLAHEGVRHIDTIKQLSLF
jgi:methylated-DNA-[protein]-cysteine S-methyltransferase